jgi:hypothetical protein
MSNFLPRKKEEGSSASLRVKIRKKEEGKIKVLAAKNSKDFNSSFLGLKD